MIDKTENKINKISGVSAPDEEFFDVCSEPFKIYGLIKPTNENEPFKRLPSDVAKAVNDGVYRHHADTAGGRVRFSTDSDTIGVYAEYSHVEKMSHCAFTGSIGLDLYIDNGKGEEYVHTFRPMCDIVDSFSNKCSVSSHGMSDYTVNFPLYSSVKKLYIILKKGSRLEKAREYTHTLPIVYYGSSITQGGCASKPGNSYQAMVSRAFDIDYINLGFSGSAKGEAVMADYIASLDMSVFVYDYDHNAPNAEHLENTHKAMFDIIRKSHPDIPIICMSMPCCPLNDDKKKRKEIIMKTVSSATEAGDSNVYFVDIPKAIEDSGIKGAFSVDGCHPNDLGFYCIANALIEELGKIIK